eukprot:1464702-Prymnesium_polylepis.1
MSLSSSDEEDDDDDDERLRLRLRPWPRLRLRPRDIPREMRFHSLVSHTVVSTHLSSSTVAVEGDLRSPRAPPRSAISDDGSPAPVTETR